MAAEIVFEQLSKTFGRRPAVKELSLEVRRGSIFGLLGHNGAGKSTTLGMLLGQVYPDAGRVLVQGVDALTERHRALRKVGAIFETPCFYDYFTGRQNLLAFGSFRNGISHSDVDEVAELVGLAGRMNDRVAKYSHGMRQRLALAQALIAAPEILVLDEPNEGLDPQGIVELRETLARLNRERGMTILFSSHLLSEVEQLCTDVAILHEGVLRFTGPLREVCLDQGWVRVESERTNSSHALLAEQNLVDETRNGQEVHLRPGVAIADLAECLVQHGHRISILAPVEQTLEDFYLERIHR